MSDTKQAETLQLAQLFESMKKSSHRWHDGTPVHEKAAAELRCLHAENEQLRAELVAEAARTAEATLRANQAQDQHRMQCNMRAADALDAARYRWLRDESNQVAEDDPCVMDGFFNAYFGDELDRLADEMIGRAAASDAKEAA